MPLSFFANKGKAVIHAKLLLIMALRVWAGYLPALLSLLLALLIGYGAGRFAGRLTGSLALTAAGVCRSVDAGLFNGNDVLHKKILQQIQHTSITLYMTKNWLTRVI